MKIALNLFDRPTGKYDIDSMTYEYPTPESFIEALKAKHFMLTTEQIASEYGEYTQYYIYLNSFDQFREIAQMARVPISYSEDEYSKWMEI